MLLRTIPGAADVQKDQVTGTPQLRITIDHDAISRYGVNVRDVQELIRGAVGGEKAGQIFKEDLHERNKSLCETPQTQ